MIRSMLRALALAGACALAYASPALAVQFTLASHVGNVWTYTLTYDPFDNYNQSGGPTTITLYGLSGVTDAGAPTSTDWDPPGGAPDLWNRSWTPTIYDNGTEVTWANATGAGTGNWPIAKHAYGFTIVSDADPGIVHLDTNGFATDAPTIDRDVTGVAVTGPAPEPGSAASLGVAMLALVAARRRRDPHAGITAPTRAWSARSAAGYAPPRDPAAFESRIR